MKSRIGRSGLATVALCLVACAPAEETGRTPPVPREIIDLGALVTEDLPERVWGKAFLEANGFDRPNSFEVLEWDVEMLGGRVSGSNAYYTLFNHGGPHVDAPNHVSVGGGVDSYPIDVFAGPLKVFDVSDHPAGRSVTEDAFRGSVDPGDVVIIYTGYVPPRTEAELPKTVTLTRAASEYLATLPVRAFGTDAFSVATLDDTTAVEADDEIARAVPIHHSFLSRGIPVYEQLFSVDAVLELPVGSHPYFVGVPLNIEGGDGMIVRPVVLVY
jgi:kynurenine formamidase